MITDILRDIRNILHKPPEFLFGFCLGMGVLLLAVVMIKPVRRLVEWVIRPSLIRKINTLTKALDAHKGLRDELMAVSGNIWLHPPVSQAPPFRKLEWGKAPVMAFFNLKGSVGKTTVAANLAAVLSRQFSKKLLLIDADWQGTLTELGADGQAGYEELVSSERLTHRLLGNEMLSENLFHPAVIQRQRDAIVQRFKELREQAHAGRLLTPDVDLFKAQVSKAPVPAVSQALAELGESPKSRTKAAEALAIILETSQKRAIRI